MTIQSGVHQRRGAGAISGFRIHSPLQKELQNGGITLFGVLKKDLIIPRNSEFL